MKYLFSFSALFFFQKSLFACPMCSDLLERGKGAFAAMRFAQGIAWSMILMFAVPFLMAGSLALLIWRTERGRKSKQSLIRERKH